MPTITLSPKLQIHDPQPQQSHRVTITGVLWIKLLRWLDKASPEAIMKALRRAGMLLLVSLLIAAPSFTLGVLTSAARWNSYRVPVFCTLLFMMLRAKPMLAALRRKCSRSRAANQHTFHGVPVGELASFLIEHGAFKKDDAIGKLALSQGQYVKIGEELEKNGVLTRGENNARVLRPIGLQNLVRQLRDNFPLAWDEDHRCFQEKDGMFARYCMSQDFKSRQLDEKVARKERKLERIEKKIGQLAPLFAHAAI